MASSASRRFVPAFTDSGAQYLFVKNLGQGAQAIAQLVLNITSGEFLVRKVAKTARTLPQLQTGVPPHTREARVLQLLQAEAAKESHANHSHIVTFHSSSAAKTQRFSQAGKCKLYRPVTYLGFCNGGDWSELVDVPLSVVFRMVVQVTEALVFMYSKGICHNDLHSANIFVHIAGNRGPDFYLGDFGMAGAKMAPEADLTHLLELIAECQLEHQSLDLEVMMDELKDCISLAKRPGAGGAFPNLDELLFIAQVASEDNPVTNADRDFFPQPVLPVVPTYESMGDFRASGIEILGPYQTATVLVDSRDGAVKSLLNIDEKVYLGPMSRSENWQRPA